MSHGDHGRDYPIWDVDLTPRSMVLAGRDGLHTKCVIL